MNLKKISQFFTSISFLLVISSSLLNAKQQQTAYPHNKEVPADVWVQLEPYFLPYDHPAKSKLDRIFKKKRATASAEDFEKAGFGKVKMRKPTNIIVGINKELEGYIIKAYLDTQPPLCEWCNWVKRIEGANAIRDCIQRHGFKDCIVPRKWIYPLPNKPYPNLNKSPLRKDFVLVVEDMRILSNKDNLKAFKKKMNLSILNQIFTIIKEEGLIDSVYPDNMPFTYDGKIAFIDTEHSHLSPVKYEVLTPFLSTKMQSHWKSFIE